jgi:N-(2-amino-2-carboxyethyl)-L-glutamate synthase
VAISPDLGEHYLETVYADEWVQEHYGEDALADDEQELVSSSRGLTVG